MSKKSVARPDIPCKSSKPPKLPKLPDMSRSELLRRVRALGRIVAKSAKP